MVYSPYNSNDSSSKIFTRIFPVPLEVMMSPITSSKMSSTSASGNTSISMSVVKYFTDFAMEVSTETRDSLATKCKNEGVFTSVGLSNGIFSTEPFLVVAFRPRCT